MRRHVRVALATLAAVSTGIGIVHCSSGSAAPEPMADGGARVDAPAPTATFTKDAKSDAPRPTKYSADGWQSIYDENPDCLLEVPSSPAAMPPAIRWEPCEAAFGDAGVPCRQMAFDWPMPDGGAFTSAFDPQGARVRADGTVLLGLLRSEIARVVLVVAEADGPVHTAMRNRRDSDQTLPCGMGGGISVGDGHASWLVSTGREPAKPYAFVGKAHGVFEIPKLYFPSNRPKSLFSAGMAAKDGLLVASLGSLDLVDWNSAKETPLVATGSLGSNEPHSIQFVGSEVLWSAGYSAARLYRASADHPAVDLLGPIVTVGRSILAFAADEKDLAWVEGLPPGDGQTILALWTIPTATPPAEVPAKARRVRVFPTGTKREGPAMQVGCGYVAAQRAAGNPAESTGMYLNRLSDGREWRLPNGIGGFEVPMAITCDEIFFRSAGVKSLFNIARVRIADLGAGYMPDPDGGP